MFSMIYVKIDHKQSQVNGFSSFAKGAHSNTWKQSLIAFYCVSLMFKSVSKGRKLVELVEREEFIGSEVP